MHSKSLHFRFGCAQVTRERNVISFSWTQDGIVSSHEINAYPFLKTEKYGLRRSRNFAYDCFSWRARTRFSGG